MRIMINGGKQTHVARIAHALAASGFVIAEADSPFDLVLTLADTPDGFRIGDVVVDLHRRRIHRQGQSVWLTPVEFGLFAHLLRARRAVGRDELLRDLWGLAFDPQTNSVAVHVSRLRRKLGAGVIETVPEGYRIAGEG